MNSLKIQIEISHQGQVRIGSNQQLTPTETLIAILQVVTGLLGQRAAEERTAKGPQLIVPTMEPVVH